MTSSSSSGFKINTWEHFRVQRGLVTNKHKRGLAVGAVDVMTCGEEEHCCISSSSTTYQHWVWGAFSSPPWSSLAWSDHRLDIPELQPNFSRFVNYEGFVVVVGSFWGYLIAFSSSWDSKGHQQLWASEKWFNKLSPLCSKTRKVLIVPKIYHHFHRQKSVFGRLLRTLLSPITAINSSYELC